MVVAGLRKVTESEGKGVGDVGGVHGRSFIAAHMT